LLGNAQNTVRTRIEAETAVTLDHNNSAALYELGLAYLYLAQPGAGILHIQKAIRLSPRDPRVSATQYGLGRCHLFLGHLDQAIELFDRVRAASPVYWEVHMWLAGALGLKGDLDAANVYWRHAAARSSDERGMSRSWKSNRTRSCRCRRV
jgi:tetratricopeptide (TPR) repeat protein